MITVGRMKEVVQCMNDRKDECNHVAEIYIEVHGKRIELCTLCMKDTFNATGGMLSSMLGCSVKKLLGYK